MKKIVSGFILCLTVLVLSAAAFSGCGNKGEVTVFDKNGECVASLKSIKSFSEYADAYTEIAVNEAVQIFCEKYSCDENSARARMLRENCEIYTALDSAVLDALKDAFDVYGPENEDAGCAVTDLHGSLIAAYSVSSDGKANCAALPRSPYSSFKPICVYAPALEIGDITWSSMLEDSPMKTITDADGMSHQWPQNATGEYSFEDVLLPVALQKSLNTVAAKCMQSLGVSNSFGFMNDKFGITLKYESDKLKLQGEDEVLGNVALGYLYEGLSPVDMAGYYQCFANGGLYSVPRAVVKICSAADTVYEKEADEQRVIKESTAYIMNRLLLEVTLEDGTGKDAAVAGVPVGGKTGTGDDGNWFVGFTPEYTCAVWHGGDSISNIAPKVFSQAVGGFSHTVSEYPRCISVKKAAYCTESGRLIGDGCIKINMGYYDADHVPGVCDIHR